MPDSTASDPSPLSDDERWLNSVEVNWERWLAVTLEDCDQLQVSDYEIGYIRWKIESFVGYGCDSELDERRQRLIADISTAFEEWLPTPAQKDYQRYLMSPEWRQIRRQVLDAAGGICERCGEKATQVHHGFYGARGEEQLENLMALCRDCHAVLHDKERGHAEAD